MFSSKIPYFGRRMVIMLLGVFGMGFFLSFLVELRLGTDPFNTCFLGLARVLGIRHGTAVLIASGILFVFQLWRDRPTVSYGTLANMILIGYISDFFRFVWGRVLPAGVFLIPAVRWSIFVPVLCLFVASAACYMAAGVGVSPYDALPGIIERACPRLRFTAVRMSMDLLCLLGGFLTGADLGIITVLMAFCLGPVFAAGKRLVERWFLGGEK